MCKSNLLSMKHAICVYTFENEFKRRSKERHQLKMRNCWSDKMMTGVWQCFILLPRSKQFSASNVSVDGVIDIVFTERSTHCSPDTVDEYFQSALVWGGSIL